jgi:hypothetical protein
MSLCARIIMLATLGALVTPALAVDRGQFTNVPDSVRAWFKNVRSPKGVPCCDVADGHRTDYDIRHDGYWVPIDGEWQAVPEEAVVRDAGNPVGEAIVWYTQYNGRTFIRCFVPGGGA